MKGQLKSKQTAVYVNIFAENTKFLVHTLKNTYFFVMILHIAPFQILLFVYNLK